MNRYLVSAVVLALAGGTIFARAQQPQERNFTVTLTERQWLYIGSLLDKEPVKDAVGVYNSIQTQVGQHLQQQAAAQQSAAEKAIRDKLAAEQKAADDAKAKADAEKKEP